MGLFKQPKQVFDYRIDTFINVDQLELEDYITEIAQERLFEGRWRLHSLKIERNGDTITWAMTVFEREINA